MYIKKLRQQHFLSQENLAENTGLSLRTIQRVESGHRVRHSSLRKLAATFEMDVDILERELYSMSNQTDEFNETPLWIRLLLGKGWFFGDRNRYEKMTSLFTALGIVCFTAWTSLVLWLTVPAVEDLMTFMLLTGCVAFFVAACFSLYCIRTGDKYGAWQVIEKGPSKNRTVRVVATFFGLIVAVNAYSSFETQRNSALLETPPWHFIGINENNQVFRNYVAHPDSVVLATPGERKLFRLYEQGVRIGVNPSGEVDLVSLNSAKFSLVYSGALPMSLTWDMTRADIERLIGEPTSVSDLDLSMLKVQYLIDGNQLDIGSESVVLELMYRASSVSMNDLDKVLVSMSIRQADN
ncbi:MAG: helix-turn-helix transcriptional regulator [Gammaproteobacteria bacterium]|nr:helix-turn-helix transcriptional regulator [Gammaproteobacteria bacterium]